MRKTTIAATALVALMASPVFAQSAAPDPAPPAASPPPATAPAPGASAATSSGTFVEAQRQDQWLVSKLMGSKVRDGADQTLGNISDVVIDGNGTVVAVVVGVGGFLGVGEKSVAVPFKSLEMVRATTGDKLVLRHTKDELKAAPSFQPYRPPSTGGAVTGSNATSPPASTTR